MRKSFYKCQKSIVLKMKIPSLNQTLLQLASQTNHSVVNNRSKDNIQSIDNNSITTKTLTNNPQPINDNSYKLRYSEKFP